MNALSLLFDLYAALDPEPPCWLDFEDGGDGRSHCLRCIKKLDKGQDKYTVGSPGAEEDTCLHCGTCGKILDYTLTDAGAEHELEHFRAVKFRRNRPLDRDTAYHLARLCAAKNDDVETTFIAARAIRCMKSIPTLKQDMPVRTMERISRVMAAG